ncbi:MAG: hypothetical protein V1794_02855 [Candidatus Glassbacteria bacterium]
MVSDAEKLTINYEEDGVLIVKELDKVVLSKGAWATLIFRYQQWEKAKNAFSDDRFTIRRYRKINNEYRQQQKFNISSADQARKLIDALAVWVG